MVGVILKSQKEDETAEVAPFVSACSPGSIAAASGLQVGDQIVRINGETVDGANDGAAKLKAAVGTVTLEILPRVPKNTDDIHI